MFYQSRRQRSTDCDVCIAASTFDAVTPDSNSLARSVYFFFMRCSTRCYKRLVVWSTTRFTTKAKNKMLASAHTKHTATDVVGDCGVVIRRSFLSTQESSVFPSFFLSLCALLSSNKRQRCLLSTRSFFSEANVDCMPFQISKEKSTPKNEREFSKRTKCRRSYRTILSRNAWILWNVDLCHHESNFTQAKKMSDNEFSFATKNALALTRTAKIHNSNGRF